MSRVEIVSAAVTHELRRTVLRPQWPPGRLLPGDEIPHALYLGARDEAGRVVSAAVIFAAPYLVHPDWPGAWQLRGMATAAGARSQGWGAQILAAAADIAADRGARLLWCEARVEAMPFYQRHGYVAEGPVFDHPQTHIPHRHMWRELPPGATSSNP
jgi:GNAT superfamily N-acetyltransferase